MYSNSSKEAKFIVIIFLLLIFFPAILKLLGGVGDAIGSAANGIAKLVSKNDFKIIASESTRFFENDLKEYAKKNKIKINIDYYGDL